MPATIAYDEALKMLDRGYMPLLMPTKRDDVPCVIIAAVPLKAMGYHPTSPDVEIRAAAVLGAMLAAYEHLERNGYEIV